MIKKDTLIKVVNNKYSLLNPGYKYMIDYLTSDIVLDYINDGIEFDTKPDIVADHIIDNYNNPYCLDTVAIQELTIQEYAAIFEFVKVDLKWYMSDCYQSCYNLYDFLNGLIMYSVESALQDDIDTITDIIKDCYAFDRIQQLGL